MVFNVPEFLQVKVSGHREWNDQEINEFIKKIVDETVSDAQIGAFLMLVHLKGLSFIETASLTSAMVQYSIKFDWSHKPWHQLVVDKHSTGGIGDKTSQVLAPILAANGLKIPMISGRGLGVTGGTLDKLEAIENYSCQLSQGQIENLLETSGFCITGQTKELVPADRKLYSIRDTTATVASLPLITASILSKKLCEGITNLILDIKVGKGMFVTSLKEAEDLAALMIAVARCLELRITVLISDMEQPLGRCAGNALEMAEVFHFLNGGKNEPRLEELVYRLCSELLLHTGKAKNNEQAVELCRARIRDGSAAKAMAKMLIGQGVSEAIVNQLCCGQDLGSFDAYLSIMGKKSNFKKELLSPASGYITKISALAIGMATWRLGAGRSHPNDSIDYFVGIELKKQEGDLVKADEALAIMHFNDESRLNEAWVELQEAFTIEPELKSQPNKANLVWKVLSTK